MKSIKIKFIILKDLIIQRFHGFFFNRYINRKYLKGIGMEVGPGENPIATSKNTIFLEKFVNDYDKLFPKAKKAKFIDGSAEDIPAQDNSFDFIVSAHCLEHCVDPIRVLKEFKRVVKSDGVIFLILPHCERTFDKGRTISSLKSHIFDHESQVKKEDYLENEGKYYDVFEEFLQIATQWPRHTWISSAKNTDGSWNKSKILDGGILHYHVWTQTEIIDLLKYVGCRIILVMNVMPGRQDSFIVAAEVQK